MKKLLWVCVLGLVLTGCGSNLMGAHYPDSGKMQENLQENGYQVIVSDYEEGEHTGTYLTAIKGDDYIEFYWLEDAKDVEDVSEELRARHNDYSEFNSMEDDSVYGSYVFCSTPDAMKSAGIGVKHDMWNK